MNPAAAHVQDQLLDFAYGELSADQARGVEAHVSECPSCRQALDEIRGVRQVMAKLAQPSAPPEGLDSLLAYAEQAARRARAGAPPKPTWWRRWIVPVGGLAAAVTFGIVAHEVSKAPHLQNPRERMIAEKLNAKEEVAEARALSAPGAELDRQIPEPESDSQFSEGLGGESDDRFGSQPVEPGAPSSGGLGSRGFEVFGTGRDPRAGKAFLKEEKEVARNRSAEKRKDPPETRRAEIRLRSEIADEPRPEPGTVGKVQSANRGVGSGISGGPAAPIGQSEPSAPASSAQARPIAAPSAPANSVAERSSRASSAPTVSAPKPAAPAPSAPEGSAPRSSAPRPSVAAPSAPAPSASEHSARASSAPTSSAPERSAPKAAAPAPSAPESSDPEHSVRVPSTPDSAFGAAAPPEAQPSTSGRSGAARPAASPSAPPTGAATASVPKRSTEPPSADEAPSAAPGAASERSAGERSIAAPSQRAAAPSAQSKKKSYDAVARSEERESVALRDDSKQARGADADRAEAEALSRKAETAHREGARAQEAQYLREALATGVADANLVTNLLLRLCDAELAIGNTLEGRAACERVVREFPSTNAAAVSRRRLDESRRAVTQEAQPLK
jgi:Putative zinc-finger